jgi:hypothetical protein
LESFGLAPLDWNVLKGAAAARQESFWARGLCPPEATARESTAMKQAATGCSEDWRRRSLT